ncbi:hypothetical protein JRQ81_005993 [Phrynocephalus forsythii]|uniref:THAP domain-containing protein 5 n=1 Tax=Phrynocephalus forsythii TaxID=171643 RepID=A0A9Q0Y460_9SAUR|nr:hypothetical protein JRQ81_005993 [Phrynocephalus forsythii]
MPRYCAATCCRNRAGQSARDQRKLSFYPFPLHDKERLEKWLRNMKRDTWTPSKHQVLCSDHFTPDSLDVRWGIRYLKTTAVPTIFSSSDNQEKGVSQKKLQEKRKQDGKESNRNVVTASLKPYSLKRNIIIEESLYEKALHVTSSKSPETEELLQNTVKAEVDVAYPHNFLRQSMEQTGALLRADNVENPAAIDSTSPGKKFTKSVENLFRGATRVLQSSVHDLPSCLECASYSNLEAADLERLDPPLEFSDTTTPMSDIPSEQVDCDLAGYSVQVQQLDENSILLHTVSQALEQQFSGNKESVITIIVPSDGSRTPLLLEGSFIPAKQELISTGAEHFECVTSYSSSEVLQTEHSYCRQDTNREQLWQKITKLHSKIALLEVQERKTLSRLKSLEALIVKLKEENLLSEEKLKIVENCFTTFEVTMIE